MKKSTKFIALVCATVLGLSVFSGCSEKTETVAEKADTFTYWAMMDGSTRAAGISDFGDMLMYKELEKLSGIHIDFIHPVQGSSGSEAFMTMLTGTKLPDMIEYTWSSYTGGSQAALDDGVVIALDEYLEEYAPNYYDYMYGEKGEAENYQYRLQSITSEGHHFGFAELYIGTAKTFSGMCVRGDLLEKWDMDMPETIDEWTAFFAKAKSEGFAYPLTGVNTDFSFLHSTAGFANGFNVGKAYYVEDGKVVFGPFKPGYKEYVAQLSDWVKLGYLDPGFVTNDSSVVQGNLTNGVSVAAWGGIGSHMGTINIAMKERNPEFKMIGAPNPVAAKGDSAKYGNPAGFVAYGQRAIAISSDCVDYKTAIGWCDYLYSEEGNILRTFGIEGDTYTIENINGEKHFVYTDKITVPSNSGVNSVAHAIYKHMFPANHPGLSQHPDYLEGYYTNQEQKDALKLWNSDLDEAQSHKLPDTLSFTDDELREKTDILEVAENELEVAVLDIILGKASIDTYDNAIAEAKKNGYDRVIKIQQAAYDRYISMIK